ncbi:hypothetical protein [Halorubrum tibetense]|uniref:Uncharacterized protein n=1 Tax=Halorubrum tibetense TaxID=175631 RepID=A0ABD5SDZ3_9EURY
MVLDVILALVVTFLIVVVGSYVGTKMALNTFFGREFDPTDIDRSPSLNSESDDRE